MTFPVSADSGSVHKWVVRNLRTVRMPPRPETKPFLKLSEAAKILNVRADRLRRWCQRGKIPCRRVGNRYELSRQNVLKLERDLEEGWRWPERDDWGESEFDPGDLMI